MKSPYQTCESSPRRRSWLQRISFLLLACATVGISHAQTSYTWNGGSGSSGNWSDNANWTGPFPSNPQGYLNFNGAARTSNTNDFASGGPGFQIYFKSGANAFTLYGNNSVIFYDFGAVDPNIQNEGAFTNQTINFPIVNGNNNGANGILNFNLNTGTAQGPLTINGTVTAADATTATRAINVSGTNTVTFNGQISDFSSSGKIAITQLGTGTTVLNASNIFTGALTINAGAVTLGASGLLGGGNYSTAITDNGLFNINSTNPLTLSGVISGSGKVSRTGTAASTLILSATNTFSGGFTNAGGIVQANTNGVFGTGQVTMNNSTAGKILLNGVTITNAMVMTAANPGTSQGVIQAVDTTSNSWTGPITINSNAAAGGHFYGPLTSGLLTISSVVTVASPGTSLQVRDGFVRLSGGGSYTNLIINNGITSLGANNGIATNTVIDVGASGGGSTFDLNGFNQTLAGVRDSTLGANRAWVTNSSTTPSTLTLTVSNVQNFNGSLVGNLAVNVTGGTQIFSNSAVAGNGVFGYTGDTTVSGGTLKLGGANLLPNAAGKGSMLVSNAATLDLNGVSQTINALSGNGTVGSLGNVAATLTVGGGNNLDSFFTGLITNNLTLTVTNPTTTLTLARVTNTFSGGVNIGNGSVNFRSGIVRAAATQSLGTGTITVGNGGNESTGRLELSNNISLNNYIVLPLRGNTSVAIQNLSGNNVLTNSIALTTGGSFAIVQVDAGTLTLGAAGTVAISNSVAASTRIVTLSGAANGTVAGNINDWTTAIMSVIKDGAGTWTLSGANTFSGDTRITNGTLTLNNTLALQNSSVDMNATDSGTLNLNNLNATLGSLKGSRNLALGTGTISVGNNNVANTYSGALSGNALTKIGSGAFILSGNSTHSGTTAVNVGELIGSTAGSVSNSAVTVAAGATNGVLLASAGTKWTCANLTYSAGTTYADFNFNGIAPSTTVAPVQVNGNLAFTVTPNVIIRSANATIAPGQYPLIKYTGSLSGTPPSVALSVPVGLTANISNNVANNSIDLVVTVGNAVAWAVGNGAWDINTTANWKNTSGAAVNYLDGEAVVLDDTASGASPIALTLSASVTPASITVNVTNKSYTIVSNAFSFVGNTPLIKNGGGTLTISSTNNLYTGAITLNAGTLSMSAASSIGSGPMTMNNGSTLQMPNSGTSVFPANAITVPSGATANFSTTALGNGIAGTVTSGDSTSVINIVGSVSFSTSTRQLDSFAGTVNVSSGNTLRFSATSGVNGSTNAAFVVNGTLQDRNAGLGPYILGSLSGSGQIGPNQTANGTGTVTYHVGTNNASTAFSGRFVDFGYPTLPVSVTNTAVVKMGTGTFTVSGNSPHSGATTVNGGALMGVTGGSFSNSAVTVNTGATNGVNITVPGNAWICTNLVYAAGTETAVFAFGGNTPSTSVAPLQVQNSVTINGTLNIAITGGSTTIPVGTYPLIAYTGTQTGSAVTTVAAMPPLVTGYITNDTANKWIALVVTNVIPPPVIAWSVGTGAWDFSSLNWTNLTTTSLVAWSDTNAAILDDTASGVGPFTVNLTTNVNPLGITFTNSANDYTLTGVGSVAGPTSLTKSGTGTLTIANSNTFSGPTTISAGTLSLGNGGSTGSLANMAIVDNGALVINRSDAVALASVITGTGSLTNAGGGTTTVSATNTYAGNTTVKSGTLQMTDSGNLAPASTLVLAGGQFTRASQNFTPVKSNAYKFGLAVVADSTVATTATTTRTVHFDSANITAVPSTTLLVTNAAATGTNRFRFYANGFTYAGNIVLGGFGANNFAQLESYNTNDTLPDQVFTGVISGQGRLYKNIEGSAPGGNLIISNSANTFSGGTELRAGYIGLGADSPLGTGNIIYGFDPNPIGFYAVDAARTLTNDVVADATSSSPSTAAGCTNLTFKGSQNLTLAGRILIATNIQFFTVNNAALTTFSGIISNAAANSLGVAKQGSGTLVFSGANAYNGDTFVNAGTLRLGTSGVIPDGTGKGNLSVAATLDLNTYSETVNGLNGAGIIDTVAGGSSVLTVGNNNASSTFSGLVKNTAGTLSLSKTGSGTFNLGGAANNTYSGLTVVNGGTLALNATTAGIYAIGGDLVINPGATVNYGAARDEQIPDTSSITNSGTISFGARNETVNALYNSGGTNLISSGALFYNGGGYSTNGYFNCTSSGIMQFSNNLTVANGLFDITYAGTSTAGYRMLGPDNTGLTITANATTATLFTNQGNASTGARFLFGPATAQAPVTQVFTSVINVQDIPGVDPDLNMGLIMTKSSGFNGSVRKDGLGKMAVSVPASSSFTITNFIINEGTLALVGAGSLSAPQNLIVNSNATFDVSGIAGGYPLGANQTLSGFGTVVGTLTNNGTIAPGASIGTLTFSNSPALNGTVLLELNRTNAQTADKLVLTVGTLNYGGTLILTNIGNALTNGDTFVVFTAPGYAGGFTNIILPSLDPSLAWNTNNLAVNGSISVALSISPSALALTSSSNPSGNLDAVAFTATVTPTNATGSVTFYNGATPISTNAMTLGVATSVSISSLARGTNTITATYLGDVNYYGSTNTLNQVVTNHPPVATLAGYYRGAVPTWKILLTDIVTNITDVDSDTITVSSLGTSTNGVTLTTGSGFVFYVNTNLVNDQFTYTVSDANGGSTTGTVNLTAQAFLNGQSATVTPGGGSVTVGFAGIPGFNYTVQRSTNVVDWASILTTNAPSGGLFQVIDDFSDLGGVPSSAYYRLQYNP